MRKFKKWQKVFVIVAAAVGVLMIAGGASLISDGDNGSGIFGIIIGVLSILAAAGICVFVALSKTQPESAPEPVRAAEPVRVAPEPEEPKAISAAFTQKVEYHKVDAKFMRFMYDDAVRRKDDAGMRYYASEMDLTFVRKKDEYYAHQEEINSDYSVIYNLSAWGTQAAQIFEAKCLCQIKDAEYLAAKYKEYQLEQPTVCEVYKKLAQVYEKQGRYTDAANICARAIVAGYPNDGTNAGMRGRLARMIRLGGQLDRKYTGVADIEI